MKLLVKMQTLLNEQTLKLEISVGWAFLLLGFRL